MKIEYSNMPSGYSKFNFTLRYLFNNIRTFIIFNFKYPWVNYNGFVRIMKHTTFAKRSIIIGNNVQFGQYCDIATDVLFGNNILIASRVCIVGRNDHNFDIPRVLIWNGDRKPDGLTIIEDDVWIGINSTIIAGVIIGKGSVIAAGSLVNKDIPSCEIWGGVPAKKIKNRFNSEEDKINHLEFLIGLAGN